MTVTKGSPGPGEGFLVTLRGRHAGDLQQWVKARLLGATPCPDGAPGACADCLAWAVTAAMLDDEAVKP